VIIDVTLKRGIVSLSGLQGNGKITPSAVRGNTYDKYILYMRQLMKRNPDGFQTDSGKFANGLLRFSLGKPFSEMGG
jgi:hypothetical protein